MMESSQERHLHEKHMDAALEMAELALASNETPVGCVFVHEGTIIGRGMNDTNASMNGTRHAEFVALDQILRTHPLAILRDTDLYVTVEPCIMCASALRQLGLRAVYFGCSNDKFGGMGGVLPVHVDAIGSEPPLPGYGGIHREQAIMLLRRFYVQVNEKAPEPHKRNRTLKEDILPDVGKTRVFGDATLQD